MACKTSYELHHHFPKLAEESGFTFNTHRPRIHIDWNKIRLIDIDNLIRDRKFVVIEQHVNDILDCVLESEFDVRILDEGVMKMFRLAQLAVEYHQFCRHYLDRSVYVLREEIATLAQELDIAKKDLREKEEDLKKLKRKSRHSFRAPIPYGNDNIATMILKTLNNKPDIFPSTSNFDTFQYNKCNYCNKVFLNQLYLRSHISRRHINATEIPQRDITDNVTNNTPTTNNDKDNAKVNNEIMELKSKLKEMEEMIIKTNTQNLVSEIKTNENMKKNEENVTKEVKDVEVSTTNQAFILDKFEEWKKEESEKYNREINLLRNQMIETINAIKEHETPSPVAPNLIDQLHSTIKQQGEEILALKQELIKSKLNKENEEAEKKKEAEIQITLWEKRAEAQTKKYDILHQKLNEVLKEAQESQAMAAAERERAAQLQVLLEQKLNDNTHQASNVAEQIKKPKDQDPNEFKKKPFQRSNSFADRKTLEQLHRKAQELLNIGSISSSDISSEENAKTSDLNKSSPKVKQKNKAIHKKEEIKISQDEKYRKNIQHITNHMQHDIKEPSPTKATKLKEKSKTKNNKINSRLKKIEENGSIFGPGSPIKVVRAKITEEVNNRLVSVGVDPLKSRLPRNIFQKQRAQLQQHQELKAKKNPTRHKVKHSILAYLDSNISITNEKSSQITKQYTSPSKMTKAFSLTSMISNVKNKALSLVKTNERHNEGNNIDSEVARKAISLLRTPSGSEPSSPETERHRMRYKTEKKRRCSNSKLKDDAYISDKIRNIDTTKNGVNSDDDLDKSIESDHKYYNTSIKTSATSIDNLIKSPARRPSSANSNNGNKHPVSSSSKIELFRTQSATNISHLRTDSNDGKHQIQSIKNDDSSDDVESLIESPIDKVDSEVDDTRHIPKQTKGVLKNASSTSSLNKKKVLFDMDAIQMKSLSVSPSQSTEKSDGNEKFELGLVNLDGEEWDLSSIENEPLKNDTKIQNTFRTSPKIAELKEAIETKLARRNETPTAPIGGVDVLTGSMVRANNIGGSNTSLGSSILDESEISAVNHKAFVKPKKIAEKYDSDMEISEFSIDALAR